MFQNPKINKSKMYFQRFLATNNNYITVNAYSTHWIDIWAYRKYFWSIPPTQYKVNIWHICHKSHSFKRGGQSRETGNIFDYTDYSYIWFQQVFQNSDLLLVLTMNRLHEQFIQGWHSLIQNSPNAINYRLFKDNFVFENYFNILEEQVCLY